MTQAQKVAALVIAALVAISLLMLFSCTATSGATPTQQLTATGLGLATGTTAAAGTANPLVGAVVGFFTWLIAKLFQTPVQFEHHGENGMPPPSTGWSFGTYIVIVLALIGLIAFLKYSGKVSFDWFSRFKTARKLKAVTRAPQHTPVP